MRYFNYIEDRNIFYKEPEHFMLSSDKETLSHALGATLYIPATRDRLLKDILTSMAHTVVICLEDSVPTSLLEEVENNLFSLFERIESESKDNKSFLNLLPLIFIRVRNKEQLQRILEKSKLIGLCGFVLPKFKAVDGKGYLEIISKHNKVYNKNLYAMPILETAEIIFKETRINELLNIKKVLDEYKETVLVVRIGGTDFSGIYSLRRNKEVTIYDVSVIRDCIIDIVNIFKRDGYVISAAVNEYFDHNSEVLIKEALLDKANGFLGKTVIHPKQVKLINSLMVVSKEEFLDAEAILKSDIDGVIRSAYLNKMNEVKPHLNWAKEVMLLSKITGVLNDGRDFRDLL